MKSQAERYAELCGQRALERQVEVSRTRHGCCWEPIDGPHHEVCPKRPKDAPAPMIDGQVALA